jgi:general secretion pathway protein D
MNKRLNCLLTFCLAIVPFIGFTQTIAEKKSEFLEENQEMTPELHRQLLEINRQLKNSREELSRLYNRVADLYDEDADPENYQYLLNRINEIRENNLSLENSWRDLSVRLGQTESYALWHQPETTIGQLVMDYGSQDYVYLLSPEIAAMPVSVDSNLLIPRASWGEMLDIILTQSGVGYRQLNPYLRQLFLLKDNKTNIEFITNNRADLELFSPESRVAFMLTPEPAEVRRTWIFLEKFINPNSTVLQMVGRDILIIGPAGELIELLKLYDFVAINKGDKEYRVFPVTRVDVEEMARILGAIFDQAGAAPTSIKLPEPPKTSPGALNRNSAMSPANRVRSTPIPIPIPIPVSAAEGSEISGIKIIPLSNIARAIFLVGTKEEIRKAEQIIRQVESQVGQAREKVIYWYTARHSDPEELAEVLHKIYLLMIRSGVAYRNFPQGAAPPGFVAPGFVPLPVPPPTADAIADEIIEREIEMLPSELYQTSYYQQGNYIVNPSPVEPKGTRAPTVNNNRDNFLVDPKTGSIAMVVEADVLPKIKDLIKKIDVPKRMVQIEVLLFERRVTKLNNFGLNLLKIGECASQTAAACFSWNDTNIIPTGILDFFFSGQKHCGLPAYDAAFRFLMSQDDIQINASPSVVAINQTPATIAIVEEISINTGIYNVETARGNTLERAFTRAQYGITISMTPTIHITEGDGYDTDMIDEEPNYVTLDTDITFDTVQPGLQPDRPDVTRRHITNEVRIPDGQTVILGGLRRKTTDDFKESIPFIGDVPGIGKLFSMRELSDSETEMFIFLTPTIISDPLNDFERIKCEEMRRRPGDIPEFLCRLVHARDMEKNRVLAGSMRILFGPDPDRCRTPSYFMPSACGHCGWTSDCLPCSGEYNGR